MPGRPAALGKPQTPRANGSPAVEFGKGGSMAPDAQGSVSASRTLNDGKSGVAQW